MPVPTMLATTMAVAVSVEIACLDPWVPFFTILMG